MGMGIQKPQQPKYEGDTIEPGGIASVEQQQLVCGYVVHRWNRLNPRPTWAGSSRQVRPWGTLVVGGDMNRWINLGHNVGWSSDALAAFEGARPNIKAAFDRWLTWAFAQG